MIFSYQGIFKLFIFLEKIIELKTSRYIAALKKPEYKAVSAKNARDFVRFYEKGSCLDDAADSWSNMTTSGE